MRIFGTHANRPLVIGLVNNMPDSAVQATERQFRALLSAALEEGGARLRLFKIPEVVGSDPASAALRRDYEDIGELWSSGVDGLIVTGAEPRAASLTEEPYWPAMTRIVDWAEANAVSTVWSCLAAHAAALHLDGIARRRLGTKLSGLFDCAKAAEHEILDGMPPSWRLPHSRYNDLPREALTAAGYRMLSVSAEAGADMFLREGRSLFLFLQGHPEYDPGALFREYRRDVGRFLAGERDLYPEMPRSYLDTEAEAVFAEFRLLAERRRDIVLLEAFPSALVEGKLVHHWREPANRLFANWLGHLAARPQTPCSSTKDEAGDKPDGATGALFPPRETRARVDSFLDRRLARAQARIPEGAVTPGLDPDRFRAELAEFDFRAPRPLDQLLDWTIERMEHGLVQITHPRYFGLFNPQPTFPAQCADRVTAIFNPQLASMATSPAAIAIESHLIRAIASRAGLPPESTGHFTTGGAEANYTAALCALTRANPEFAAEGARAFKGPPVFYVSRESHLAWLKIAQQAGIGRSAVRLVATDGSGRMDMDVLSDTIRADSEQGCVPFMIAATAGTTNAGMVDPLPSCVAIARRHGLWLHADAAWGGALIASERLRPILAGLEEADSVTIDAHKWLATTMGCGMFLTRHPALPSAVFHVSTSFMPSDIPHLDPYQTTIQWSRRFFGLRLFLSLASAGWAGYAAHVERSVSLIKYLETNLASRGWRIVNDSSLAVLCFEPPAGPRKVRPVVEHVLASGRAWVAATKFEGSDVIRACASNGATTRNDVIALVGALEAANAVPDA